MNIRLTAALCALSLLPMSAMADITVNLPAGSGIDSIAYFHAPIAKLVNAKSSDQRDLIDDKAVVKENTAVIPISSAAGGSRYWISMPDNNFIDLYVFPGETVVADIKSVSPLDYSLSGTVIAEGISEVNELSKPLISRQKALMDAGQPDQEEMVALYREYVEALNDYIEENLTSPKSILAIMPLQGEDFVKAFNRLSEGAKASFVYPLAEQKYGYVNMSLEQERKQQAMASGNTPAPGFTLEDIAGKQVSLDQFKGKWVILDFWGSWCIWCIKGFPELKEAYTKYKDRLEIIGIDCRESKEAWKAGVEKYQLSWVNVYNPEGSTLTEQYGVQGFPTKAIVDPEGKIRNITTGHDPAFFEKLDALLAQ